MGRARPTEVRGADEVFGLEFLCGIQAAELAIGLQIHPRVELSGLRVRRLDGVGGLHQVP